MNLNSLQKNQNVVSNGISSGTFTSDGLCNTTYITSNSYTASSLLNNGAN